MGDSLFDNLTQDALDSAMQGRTAITISHRLSSVVTSDIIYVMQKGQVDWPGNRHQEECH
jgi:ABC-type multidrug transport system fused ATPase/permease subunit